MESMGNIDWNDVLNKAGFIIAGLVGIAAVILFMFFPVYAANWLGKLENHDWFFKTVKEGQSKSVMSSDGFWKAIMSYQGHRFRRNSGPFGPEDNLYDPSDPAATYWDIIPGKEWWEIIYGIPVFGKLTIGLRWIGLPSLNTIDRYKFDWTSWDQKRVTGPDGKSDTSDTTNTEKLPIAHSKEIDYILVVPDTYLFQVRNAETKTTVKNPVGNEGPSPESEVGQPADLKILLTAQVRNPFKARHRVGHWLRTITNQLEVYIKEFTAGQDFDDLANSKEAQSDALYKYLERRISEIRANYGVEIQLIQIQSVEPAGSSAELYRQLGLEVYTAQQKAKARRIEADAEENYLLKTLSAASKNPEANKWQNISQLKGTYVEGSNGANQRQIGVTLPLTPNNSSITGPGIPTSDPSSPTKS